MGSNGANQILGGLEKEIMKVVWTTKRSVTVREVFSIITRDRSIAYTTVMTVMGRLVSKGLLKRQAVRKAYIYKAAYSKDKFLGKISRQIINNLLSSFGETAIAHFAEELERIPANKRKRLASILKNSKDEN